MILEMKRITLKRTKAFYKVNHGIFYQGKECFKKFN